MTEEKEQQHEHHSHSHHSITQHSTDARGPILGISKALVVLSILGIIVSLYLTWHHYALIANPHLLSFCDVSTTFNCSEVNSSKYASFLGTPVALLGLLYFLTLLIFSIKSLKTDSWYKHLAVTYGFGIFFSLYLIYAEFALKTICTLCTVLHIIIITGLILSITALKKTHSWKKGFLREYLWSVAGYLFLFLLVIGFSNLPGPNPSNVPAEFGTCLKEAGLVEYASYTCSACIAQKKLLGNAYKNIDAVECHPEGPGANIPRCKKVPIEATPTWTIEKNGTILDKKVGLQTLEDLATWSNCTLTTRE